MKMDDLMFILAGTGAITIFCIVVFALLLLRDLLSDFIEAKKYNHIRKHRFDKPPTAKCYCVDCRYWRPEDGYCHYFEHRYTADCWFCWNAEPLTHREYAKRESNNE